jgi:predicted nucleotide-binding protein (sugar kinase/HSP70/actin superfamily)
MIAGEKIQYLSGREIDLLLEKKLIRKNEDGSYVPCFGIYRKSHNNEALRYAVPIDVYNGELLPMWNELIAVAEDYVVYCENVMKEEIPERLQSQFNYYMHEIPFLRGMVVEGLIEKGFLKPDTELSELLGTYIMVE